MPHTLGHRVKALLNERSMTQSQLARMVGVKQQTISYICSPENPASVSRYAPKIAEVLGVNPSWLQTGEGVQHDPVVRIELDGMEFKIQRLPLLRIEQIGEFVKSENWEVKGKELMTDVQVGRGSFAIEIEGESMAPIFRSGDRVVIDPTIEPEPGDYVAAIVGDSTITFRKYRARGVNGNGDMSFELVPLNDDWPIIRSDTTKIEIVGVMAEHRSYRKH